MPTIIYETTPGPTLKISEFPDDLQEKLLKFSKESMERYMSMFRKPGPESGLTDQLSWSTKAVWHGDHFVYGKNMLRPCIWHFNYRRDLPRFTIIANDDVCYDQCWLKEGFDREYRDIIDSESIEKGELFQVMFNNACVKLEEFKVLEESVASLRQAIDLIEQNRSETSAQVSFLQTDMLQKKAVFESKKDDVARHIARNLTVEKYQARPRTAKTQNISFEQWIELETESFGLAEAKDNYERSRNLLTQAQRIVDEKRREIAAQKPAFQLKEQELRRAAHTPYYYLRRSFELVTELAQIKPINYMSKRSSVQEELSYIEEYIPDKNRDDIYERQKQIQTATVGKATIVPILKLGTISLGTDGVPIKVTQEMVEADKLARNRRNQALEEERLRLMADAAVARYQRQTSGLPEETTTLDDRIEELYSLDDVEPTETYNPYDERFNTSRFGSTRDPVERQAPTGHQPRRR